MTQADRSAPCCAKPSTPAWWPSPSWSRECWCPPDPTVVHFPLAETLNDFLDDYEGGALDGIRPDHVQFIQGLQPFNAAVSTDWTPSALRFLQSLIGHPSSPDVVTAWAHLAC